MSNINWTNSTVTTASVIAFTEYHKTYRPKNMGNKIVITTDPVQLAVEKAIKELMK